MALRRNPRGGKHRRAGHPRGRHRGLCSPGRPSPGWRGFRRRNQDAESGLNRRIFAGVKKHAISELLDTAHVGQNVTVCGWVRTFRNNQFLSVNDGSCLGNLRILDREGTEEALLKRLTTVRPSGLRAPSESQGAGQATEVDVTSIEVLGDADPEVPHPDEAPHHGVPPGKGSSALPDQHVQRRLPLPPRLAAIHEYSIRLVLHAPHPIITGSDAEERERCSR